MKEGVIDVLMYIFSSYADQDENLPEDRDGIDADLRAAGFEPVEIDKAFDWLDDLADLQEKQQFSPVKETSTRIYSEQEKKLIGIESIGFLHFLEQTNILTPVTRELILDRVVALGQPLDAEQMKWIIMIVLHAHPGEENALALLENFIFDEVTDLIQ